MRIEYGEDEGLRFGGCGCANGWLPGSDNCSRELDAFNPDFVVIWGDDQYENFRGRHHSSPFCVLAFDDFNCQPFANGDGSTRRNVWGETPDTTFNYAGPQGRRPGAGIRA